MARHLWLSPPVQMLGLQVILGSHGEEPWTLTLILPKG